MSEPSPQQKANLARIRDNQRRSRARRKEYLQELETKYRTCEAVGAEASTEIQAAARKVLEENKRLRRLLRQQGLSEADIDGADVDESTFPTTGDLLDHMLSNRKACRSGSSCDDSQVYKTEDDEDYRRQSCSSAPAGPAPRAPGHSRQHQSISLAPGHVPIAPRPASHEPLPSLPQQQHLHPQTQQPLQPQTQPQLQQPFQYHNQPLQHQQPLPQYHMTSPSNPASHASVPHQALVPASQSTSTTYPSEYPLYAPQPYSHAVPNSQVLDWDMASPNGMPNSFVSPPLAHSVPVSFASPTSTANTGYNGDGEDNTSSCFVAADVIRGMHANAGLEVETALGCGNGTGECRVDNSLVFDVMDRYSAIQGPQHSGM